MCFQRLLGKYKFLNPQVAVEVKDYPQLWGKAAESFRATGAFLKNWFRSEWQTTPRFGGIIKKCYNDPQSLQLENGTSPSGH